MPKMNTDKTLRKDLSVDNEYPSWYYKKLKAIDIDDVIMYLLITDKFIVDIEGIKVELTFGKNKKNEIGYSIKWSDYKHISMTSYETIQKAFTIGKWYILSETDTTQEFKDNFNKEKDLHRQKELRRRYLDILTDFIRANKTERITDKRKEELIQAIKEYDFETLDRVFKELMKKINSTD